jgi:hypothetical protein
VWIGQFKEGALTGKGELIGADGSHYIGQFSDWRFSGQGRLNLSDGSFYIGGFDSDSYRPRHPGADRRHRAGGTWINGQRVRDADGKLLPDPSNSACWPRAACWMPRWPPCPPRPRPSSCTP